MTAGGCSSKLDSDRLLDILRTARIGPASRQEFADAYVGPWPSRSGLLAASVDLLYDFGLTGPDFGRVAASHCLSDIYASLSRPALATACLGVSRSAVADGRASSILAGLNEGLRLAGAKLANGHTVHADSLFIAVTVIASDPVTIGGWQHGRYRLLLSKPLGTGIHVAALRNGLLSSSAEREAVEVMRTGNASAASGLIALTREVPSSLGFVTDVSGFGLLMALHSQLPEGAHAQIDVDRVPTLLETRSILEKHAVATGLGDRNFDWASRGHVRNFSALGIVDRLILSDPQTSGGLLTAVRDEVEYPTDFALSDWWQIGHVILDQSIEPAARSSVAILEVL